MPICKEAKPFTLCHPELVSGSRNSQAERTPLTRIYKFTSSLINSTLSRKGRGEKAAFTLAEVLITLGIIGVVAALTLPTLIQNYKEKQTVSQLKKAYAVISQAYEQVIYEYGTIDTWGLTKTDTGERDENDNPILDRSGQYLLKERLQKYLNAVEFDGNRERYSLTGEALNKYNTKDYSIKVSDGTIYEVGYIIPKNCTTNNKACADIWIFLPKSKGLTGIDAFDFNIQKNKIVPDQSYNFEENCDIKNKAGQAKNVLGRACTQWIMLHENMEYLHCDDLSLSGKSKCN